MAAIEGNGAGVFLQRGFHHGGAVEGDHTHIVVIGHGLDAFNGIGGSTPVRVEQSSGLFLQPVQTLVASTIFAAGKNANDSPHRCRQRMTLIMVNAGIE